MSFELDDISHYSYSTTLASHLVNRQNEMLIVFQDMGFVASTLEDAIVVSNPVVYHIAGKDREVEQQEYEEDRAFVQKNHTKNERLAKKLDRQAETRKLMFSTIREVYPDFCKDMSQKISEEDYQFYYKQQRKMRQAIVRRAHQEIGTKKRVAQYVLERKDEIAELIDSEDFSKACMIEDAFVIAELQKYLELLKDVPKEVEHSQKRHKIPCGETTRSAEELARSTITERHDRILKFKQVLELFDKIKSKKYVEFPDKDDE